MNAWNDSLFLQYVNLLYYYHTVSIFKFFVTKTEISGEIQTRNSSFTSKGYYFYNNFDTDIIWKLLKIIDYYLPLEMTSALISHIFSNGFDDKIQIGVISIPYIQLLLFRVLHNQA